MLLFVISSTYLLYAHSTDRQVHTTAFDGPVVDHWLERKIAQTTKQDQSAMQEHPNLYSRVLYHLSYTIE